VTKILFWIDDGLIQFGIAKFLQEKIDNDFYAIYDTNHITKLFFKNQDFVKFQKVWFFRDHLSSEVKKPDIQYLKNIEEKYGLNLWQLAYSERRFFKFNEYHKFTSEEILSITEEECKFYEKILDEVNPDFISIGITDLHRNNLFAELSRAKGKKILMLWGVRFGYRTTISSDYDKIEGFNNELPPDDEQRKPISEIKKYFEKYNTYEAVSRRVNKKFVDEQYKMNSWKIIKRHLHFLIYICNDEYRKFYENWGHFRYRFLTKKDFVIPFLIKRKKRQKFLDKHASKKIEKNQLFVYFPLQHEPERSILLDAPFCTNQLEIILHVAKSIPIDYKLYVKEHFSMREEAWREISFYKKILEMPNVELIHPSVKPDELLKNCSLVSTITGSSPIEAAVYEKPSIVFGDTSYSYLPFVQKIKNINELPKIIRYCLNNSFDYTTLYHYIKLIDNISFEFDWRDLMYAIASKIHAFNGMTKEIEIPPSKMQKFFEEYKNEFELLASESVKKIEQYKQTKNTT